MKKLALLICAIVGVTFSAAVFSAGPNPVSPPNSSAFGKSLDGWMGTYFRQYLTAGVVGGKNVTFLPIECPVPGPTCDCSATPTGSACWFDVTVPPGTAIALPFVSWLGWGPDDYLPDECWGETCPASSNPYNLTSIFASASLDGQAIAEPSAAYYVGPTAIEPPILCPLGGPENYCVLYQAIGAVIKPLTPGVHHLLLHSGFEGTDPPPAGYWSITFDNTWNITVLPPGKK